MDRTLGVDRLPQVARKHDGQLRPSLHPVVGMDPAAEVLNALALTLGARYERIGDRVTLYRIPVEPARPATD